jgi:hypothetical protein
MRHIAAVRRPDPLGTGVVTASPPIGPAPGYSRKSVRLLTFESSTRR